MPALAGSTASLLMPQAWSTGDVAAVHSLMAPSCDTINPIFGERKSSREEWEEMVKDVFQVRAGGKQREGNTPALQERPLQPSSAVQEDIPVHESHTGLLQCVMRFRTSLHPQAAAVSLTPCFCLTLLASHCLTDVDPLPGGALTCAVLGGQDKRC